jgi:hypothetical protein
MLMNASGKSGSRKKCARFDSFPVFCWQIRNPSFG